MQYEVGQFSRKIFEQFDLIAGVDEVGRGPLAGPVVACAVVFRKGFELKGLNDSKKLSSKRRAALCQEIMDGAESVSWSFVGERRIDEVNIFNAARQAMTEAVQALSVAPQYLLIDAMELPDLSIGQESLIKGDQREFCIMAASIVAKEVRDGFMRQLGELHPGYGLEKHMGYGTAQHLRSIGELGVLDCHRRSFRPVMKTLLEQESLLERELADKSKSELIAFVNLIRHMGLNDLLGPRVSLLNRFIKGAS